MVGSGGGVGLGGGGGVRVDVNEELKFFTKFTKKKIRGGGGVGSGGLVGVCVWGGGQGGCERRIEVFVNIQKNLGGSGGGGGRGGSGWGGVRVDVNDELKFL